MNGYIKLHLPHLEIRVIVYLNIASQHQRKIPRQLAIQSLKKKAVGIFEYILASMLKVFLDVF